VAQQVARGAIHAVKDTPLDAGQLAHQAVIGVVRAFDQAGVDPQDALGGAGYGVVQGAAEVEVDPGQAALAAIEAAEEVARQSGVPEEVAAAHVARGALEAAEALGPEVVAEVEASLPEEIVRAARAEPILETPMQKDDGGESTTN
jgi:hypothetical protein